MDYENRASVLGYVLFMMVRFFSNSINLSYQKRLKQLFDEKTTKKLQN